jgi:hypothetical protein
MSAYENFRFKNKYWKSIWPRIQCYSNLLASYISLLNNNINRDVYVAWTIRFLQLELSTLAQWL